MKPDVLWNDNTKSNFLEDLKSFAMSLDFYEINMNLEDSNDKCVYFTNGNYELTSVKNEGAFKCPHCGAKEFEVMEGELQGKPAIGLCCIKCETYGAVFPNGM
jgi:predicted RNA-binding Zn-ribbon protein involved in translation (DUF1610 family)